ncbi:Flp family type IVb pilin [Vibrio halioticoli]|uniref:Flp family type IVb pilin n=1 Tax=Vibrio halioticoli TaxID=71388 RepID=UPI00058704CE|nr:Flp family type IVb pilin [Vibrio halioticoli]
MFKTFLTRFIKDERGVTAIEYGIIGVALAGVLIAVIGGDDDKGLRAAINGAFTAMINAMS